mgnify:FL=1
MLHSKFIGVSGRPLQSSCQDGHISLLEIHSGTGWFESACYACLITLYVYVCMHLQDREYTYSVTEVLRAHK